MTATEPMVLRECDVFCRYLVGATASPYVREKYLAAQDSLPAHTRIHLVDRALLRVARLGTGFTALADTYAAILRRRSPLRCRLVLAVAILENAAETHALVDTAIEGSRAAAAFDVVVTGLWWTARLAVAVVVFAPIHLLGSAAAALPGDG